MSANGLSFIKFLTFGVAGIVLNSRAALDFKLRKSEYYRKLEEITSMPWKKLMYQKMLNEFDGAQKRGGNALGKGPMHYISELNDGICYATTLWFIDDLEEREIEYNPECLFMVTGYTFEKIMNPNKTDETELIEKIKKSKYVVLFDNNGIPIKNNTDKEK